MKMYLPSPLKNTTLRSTPTPFWAPLVGFGRSAAPPMIRCHLSTLMHRDKLRIADVARLTGLNRSTVTALYRNTATRIELPAVDLLCALFRCSVGDLLEYVADEPGRAA